MSLNIEKTQAVTGPILVLGATGKTGRRIVAILEANGHRGAPRLPFGHAVFRLEQRSGVGRLPGRR